MAEMRGTLNKSVLYKFLCFENYSAQYSNSIDTFVKTHLGGRGVPSIPTLKEFCSMFKEYRATMVSLYDKVMADFVGKSNINDDIKVCQMSLCEGVMFAYDSMKDTYSLVSACYDVFSAVGDKEAFKKSIVAKNKKGQLKVFRVDLEYSGDTIGYKLVNARDFDIDDYKDDNDSTKRFFLVPSITVFRYMSAMQYMLNLGTGAIKVTQLYDSVEKVRFISINQSILEAYSDNIVPRNLEDLTGMRPEFYPLEGYFRAPAVGAPSTTLGMTKVDIFRVIGYSLISNKDIEKQGIEKPKNPFADMYLENYLTSSLLPKNASDGENDELNGILRGLPHNRDLSKLNVDNLSPSTISMYLRSLTNSERESLIKYLGVDKEANRYSEFYLSCKPERVPSSDFDSIAPVVKSYPVRVVIRKKDGSLSAFMCTNSNTVLRSTYGNDFMKKFESFGVKFYYLVSAVSYNYSPDSMNPQKPENLSEYEVDRHEVVSLLNKYGLNVTNNSVTALTKYINYVLLGTVNSESEGMLKSILSAEEGVDLSKSRPQVNRGENVILVRGLSAYIDGKGKVQEYYKNLDTKKIVSAIVFK